MITPHQRLERMRKSFDKNRSISYDDYIYFTAPEISRPRASILRNKAERKSAGQSGPKSPKQS
jgi:hypothetical protein